MILFSDEEVRKLACVFELPAEIVGQMLGRFFYEYEHQEVKYGARSTDVVVAERVRYLLSLWDSGDQQALKDSLLTFLPIHMEAS